MLPRSTKRRDVLRTLKALGWEEKPKGRSKETFVTKAGHRPLRTFNEHGQDIHVSGLKDLLRRGGITDDEWMAAYDGRAATALPAQEKSVPEDAEPPAPA